MVSGSRSALPWCSLVVALTPLWLLAGDLRAEDEWQRGSIKAVDAENRTITITRDGRDQEFTVSEDATILDASGRPPALGLRFPGFAETARVVFKLAERNGKTRIVRLESVSVNRPGQVPVPPPQVDVSKLIPLTDMGETERYQGFPGGLYPGASSQRPASHEAAGLALARQIQPLDRDGKPSAVGKVVLLAVGMSNTRQAFEGLMRVARDDKALHPKLVLVNGALGGMTAVRIQHLDGGREVGNDRYVLYWQEVGAILDRAGLTPAQVQSVWIKQADAVPTEGFPRAAQILEGELARITHILHQRFTNLKLVYLSSRTYGGWARIRLNPEPYAYEGGFAVKWLIERQSNGDPELNFDPAKGPVRAPWLSWGPYLWARGDTPRGDGFRYEESDFMEDDRTHQSPAGQEKVGRLLLEFFKTDTTTKDWFTQTSSSLQK